MLSLAKLKEVLEENNKYVKMNNKEFLNFFLPGDKLGLEEMMDVLSADTSYRSRFLNGEMKGHGMTTYTTDFLSKLVLCPAKYLTVITERCSEYLSKYMLVKDGEASFKKMLIRVKEECVRDEIIESYIEDRKDEPETYADVLAVLFLYGFTYLKKDDFITFFTSRHAELEKSKPVFKAQNAELFADCGKARTIIRKEIIEKELGSQMKLSIDFQKNELRDVIPDWCSAVFIMPQPCDIHLYRELSFRVFQEAVGIRRIQVEIKPADRSIAHYTYMVDLQSVDEQRGSTISIDLKQVDKAILKQFKELCFVVKMDDFVDPEDITKMNGSYRIGQIRLN